MKSGLSKTDRGTAKALFKEICYCPHRRHVERCVQDLHQMSEQLKKYLDREVDPLLGNFSRAYLGHVHALGYNTTSPAESMNRLLKHGLAGRPTLEESRRHFNIVLADHQKTSKMKLARRRHPVVDRGWVPNEIYKFVGRRAAEAIMHEFEKGKRLQIDVKNGQLFGTFQPSTLSQADLAKLVFIAREGGSKDLTYELTISGCECGLLGFRGIPCSHLLRLHKYLGLEFPRQLIHSRWCRGEPDSDGEEFREDGYNERTEDDDASETIEGTAQQRYNLLFGLGKQLASNSSRSKELAERYIQGLRAMLAEMIDLPPEALEEINPQQEGDAQRAIVDVVDDVGRPKGRPKRKRLGRN